MTTRKLILMRHAKSDWANESLSDHQRPLNERGRRDAPRMANWLADEDLIPDVVHCSSARRTCETMEIMNTVWTEKPELLITDTLYLASPEQILQTVRSDSMNARRVMVLAHNPGMASLASMLGDQSIDMPTAAIAVFELDLERWDRWTSGTKIALNRYMRPKALND